MRKLVFALVLLPLGSPLYASEVDHALLNECRGRWEALERAGSQVEAEYTLTIREASGGEPTVFKKAFLVGGTRVLYRTDDSAVRRRPNDLVHRFIGVNSAYSFRAGRKRGADEYVVTHLGQPDADMKVELAAEFVAGPGSLWSYHKTLTELVAGAEFRVESAQRVAREGREVVVIVGSYTPAQPSPRYTALKRLELVLDPAASCSILSYSAVANDDYTFTGKISHTPDAKGLPVPTLHTVAQHDGKKPVRTIETAFTKWNYRSSIDDGEFRLSALGLPETVDAPPPAPRTPRYVWFVAAAVGFAALAIVFRWLTRRRNPPPAPEGTT